MELGMIGLGRMGANMVRRLLRAGHACAVYDLHPEPVQALAGEGARGAASLEDLVAGAGGRPGGVADGARCGGGSHAGGAGAVAGGGGYRRRRRELALPG